MKLLVASTLATAVAARVCCLGDGGCADMNGADTCGDGQFCCSSDGSNLAGTFSCCLTDLCVVSGETLANVCQDPAEVHGYQITWDYDKDSDIGPKRWKDTYPGCGKMMQSPINLKTGSAKHKKNSNLPDLKITPKPDEDDMTTWEFHNVGNALIMSPDTANANWQGYELTGGINDNTYNLDHARLTWKAEHEVNGNRQEAELQIYWHSGEASAVNQEWTVFAIMINEGGDDKDLDPLYDAAKAVKTFDSKTNADLSLRHLLPKDYDEDYYTYYGSATTPPCTEGIRWVLPRYMLKSDDDQIDRLKDMRDQRGNKMEKLYRNEQRLNARQVFKSFKPNGGGFNFWG